MRSLWPPRLGLELVQSFNQILFVQLFFGHQKESAFPFLWDTEFRSVKNDVCDMKPSVFQNFLKTINPVAVLVRKNHGNIFN